MLSATLVGVFLFGDFVVGFIANAISFASFFIVFLVVIVLLIRKYYNSLKSIYDEKVSTDYCLSEKENQIVILDDKTNKTICVFCLRDIKNAKKYRRAILLDVRNEKYHGIVILPNLNSIRCLFSKCLKTK